jgi:MFS family permease
MGFLYITASAVLPQWFSKRCRLAVAIASSGAGIGGLASNLGAGTGIESVGWGWTYVVLAITTLILNLNLSCIILMKDRNKLIRPHKRSFDVRQLAHISTWLIIIWGWLTELGYVTLLYSLPNYALSIGLTVHQGSVVGAMLNLGIAVGRPPIGYWSDRINRINVAIFTTALCGIFCLAIWVPAKSYAVLTVFALASGTVTGTLWATVVPVTADIVGMQRLPLAFGMICLPLVLPITFAEGIALQLVSSSGYLTAQVFVGCMYLLGAASIWGLRSWKVRELDEDAEREREGRSSIPIGSVRTHERVWLTPRGMLSWQKV